MSNIYKYLGVAVLAGLLVVAGYLVKKPTTITYNTDGTKTVVGALASPALGPWYSVGDTITDGSTIKTLNQASTTICSFLSPAATSTLTFASAQITTGTTTVIAVEMGKGAASVPSNIDATTTRITYVPTLASGSQLTINAFVASTTALYGAIGVQHTADENDLVFAPNTRLNVKYGGARGALNVLVGSCHAVWTEDN